VTGITRPITSIHAGMSTPPTPVTIRSIRSITASAAAGARSARKNAASASPMNGTRSHTVYRRMNGSFRASDSVWPAANRDGRNQPSVMTAGMAPMTTLGAPRWAANAGRIVDWDANASPTTNSA